MNAINRVLSVFKKNKVDYINELNNLIIGYCEIVEQGVAERLRGIPLDLYEPSSYEVVGSLLCRQATLATELAQTIYMWNGHIAPIILRAMADVYITLAWIVDDVEDRCKEFILYGLGQEKLQIEHNKKALEENPDREDLKILVQTRESWLNSNRAEFLTVVNVGSWSGKTAREMADEAGCLDFYHHVYTPFSSVTHSMWNHVSKYNLTECKNQLHGYHKLPSSPQLQPDPDYLHKSAKYLEKTFRLIDGKYDVVYNAELPMRFVEMGLHEINKKLIKEGHIKNLE